MEIPYARAERRFDAQVDRSRGIVEQVALDSPFLSMGCIYRRQQECQHEINLIHFLIFYCLESDRVKVLRPGFTLKRMAP